MRHIRKKAEVHKGKVAMNDMRYLFAEDDLPADSSNMIDLSDIDFGSSDSASSSLGSSSHNNHLLPPPPSHPHPPSLMMVNGNSSSYNNDQNAVQRPSHHHNASRGPAAKTLKGVRPGGGKPAAMAQQACHSGNNDSGRSKTTDLFLSQFQAQMSQMKSAMDAVQNEMFHQSSSVVLTGKPRSMVANATLSQPTRRGPGRPRGSASSSVATTGPGGVRYQSQVSTLNGIKLKIKKSPRQLKRKGSKSRGRRKKKRGDEDDDEEDDDEDASEGEKEVRKFLSVQKSTKLTQSATAKGGSDSANKLPSGWGDQVPERALERILSYAVKMEEGCIPMLVRASKVSRLWWKTASKPELWTSVDLSSHRVKDKFKIERNLTYFLEHRFPKVKNLNLGGWSAALTNASIDVLVRSCKDLESLGLNGCQKLSATHLKTITESCVSLKKLDLSAISTTYNTKTAVAPGAIGEAAETMGERLTHLSLSHNCLANCPQIVLSLADHCPSLQALDLSNVTSPRRDSIPINIELFQQGCQKLKILRLTNSDFILSETSLKEQVCSRGFPLLEELSIAVDPKKCVGMDENDLERILKSANKLRLLDVRGCSRIGDSGLVRISAWDLEHLYLSGCYATKSSNDGLELVARKWRHSFKEIDFSWTPGEETINSAMKVLAEVGNDDVLPLRILDLCGSSVSFDSVKLILRNALSLERLNLTSCRALPRGIKRNYQTFEEVSNLREQVLTGKFDDHPDD